tara:strand:- start:96 stop:323 length:228 start_codon:yes stop_codon:yes gene_type:complete
MTQSNIVLVRNRLITAITSPRNGWFHVVRMIKVALKITAIASAKTTGTPKIIAPSSHRLCVLNQLASLLSSGGAK